MQGVYRLDELSWLKLRYDVCSRRKCSRRKLYHEFFIPISEHFRAYLTIQLADHSDIGIIGFLLQNLSINDAKFLFKVTTSELKQRPTLVTVDCRRHGSQWVKKNPKIQISGNSWCY